MSPPPVIAIDGPTASGKGTVARLVSERLGWNYLDSGGIYRAAALWAQWHGLSQNDAPIIAKKVNDMPLSFTKEQIFLDQKDVTLAPREEAIGNLASQIAVDASLRAALLERQRAFLVSPGLVADGRDMGSIVFPDAELKIFLDASVETRARRRFDQLQARGEPAIMSGLVSDLLKRDARDKNRSVAPLVATFGAKYLDTSQLSATEATEQILVWWQSLPK